MDELLIHPIGIYRSEALHPFDVGRQPRPEDTRRGRIELRPKLNFEQALQGLEGFERIWLLTQFHLNSHWHPMVTPPRGDGQKKGVFATRAPYRPNPLGLSCVKLVHIEGLHLEVEGADLLDQTPILDIKPYLPEADAFPGSAAGWVDGLQDKKWSLSWQPELLEELDWLEAQGLSSLRHFFIQQLEYEPLDVSKKRVKSESEDSWILAYRTWRLRFRAKTSEQSLELCKLQTGYSEQDLQEPQDPWGDKDVHRRFVTWRK